LFPPPKVNKYRFAGEIKHQRSVPIGSVGFFFTHHQPNPAMPDFRFYLAWGMNEALDIEENPKIRVRRLFLSAVAADPEQVDDLVTFAGRRLVGVRDNQWKPFAIDVDEDSCLLTFSGEKFPAIRFQEINKRVRKELDARIQLAPQFAGLVGALPDFSTKKSLGLFIRTGAAYFKNITLKKL
jgi:hypothetical protein